MTVHHQDLEELIKLAKETGKLFAGKEIYKLFEALPSSDNGVILSYETTQIEIIENTFIDPYSMCSIQTKENML